MEKYNRYVDLDKKQIGDIWKTLFPLDNILHLQGRFFLFVFFADVRIQINAVSSTFSSTDLKHVLLICFDIFSSMFLILNNI